MVLNFLPRQRNRPSVVSDTTTQQKDISTGFEQFLRGKFDQFQQQEEPTVPVKRPQPMIHLPPKKRAAPIQQAEEESKLKDIWDAFAVGGGRFAHGAKQFFTAILPQMLSQARQPEPTLGVGKRFEERKLEVREQNKFREEAGLKLQEKFEIQEQKYEEWIQAHPELKPRKEWDRPVIDVLKEDPKILLDPAYWGFIFAESAAYSLSFLGTAATVTVATGNPLAGMAAGVAVTAPATITDLHQDLIASGATPEQASKISPFIGTVIASIEIVGGFPLLKAFFPQFSRILTREVRREVVKLTMKQLLKKGVKTFTQIEVAEVMEELAQDAIQNATVKVFDENRDMLANIPETTLRTLIATAPLALVGGGVQVARGAGEVGGEGLLKVPDLQREEGFARIGEEPEVTPVTPEVTKPKGEQVFPEDTMERLPNETSEAFLLRKITAQYEAGGRFGSKVTPEVTPTEAPPTAPQIAEEAPEAVVEGITPQAATQIVNEIQQQGTIAPKTVPPEEAKYAHIEKSAPDGTQPPKPPRARPPTEAISPESKPLGIFQNILDKQLEGERLDQTIVRLYGAAVRNTNRFTGVQTKKISDQLKDLGIGQVKRGQLVPREQDKPILDELYIALHNPTAVDAGEITVPAGFETVYSELRALADWTTASRLEFDPNAATLDDWFFRGWKPPEGMFTGAPGKGGLVTEPRALRTPRVGATYQEMRELGFEPLFWNPAHQWGYRHNLGEIYREQMELVEFLKKQGDEFIMPDSGGPMREGWKIPRIGPAFEGKPFAAVDADGLPAVMYTRRWVVPAKTANLLESMFGRRPDLGTIIIGKKEINPLDISDVVAFVPKRAKLLFSFFQQMDFLNRAGSSSWAKAIDDIFHGRPDKAAIATLRYPKTVLDILHANFSSGKRLSIAEQMSDTAPLIKDRPGITLKGISEAGLSTVDVTILSNEMDKLMRVVAEKSGIWAKFKGVGDSLIDLESAMRRGLFQGVYPAAMITDIKNNLAVMMARQHPRATDEQINGYIAQEANIKYSTLSVEQSVVHNTFIRETLRRIAFSFNESEALIRQTTRMFHGPNKAYWAKQNAGVILFLAVVANIIHFASTGEPLPKERYIPIAKDNWGPLPFSYNTKFLSPTLPIRGRGDVEITADLMGQMDTVWRLFNPGAFITSRLSVPIRALINQISGTDFYGATIEGPAQRSAQLAFDLFAPIGLGGIGVEGARQGIPGAEDVLPEGESRLGLTGLALQATGLNVRAEGTREVLDRKARESGFVKRDGTPVMNWDELEPHQRAELNKDKALIAELALRRETSLRRDVPGATGSAKMEELDQARIIRGESLVTEFEQGLYPGTSEFTREVTKLKAEIANRRAQVDDDFQLYQDTLELPQDPNKRALVEYYNIFDMAKRESETIDWTRVEQIEDAYRTQVWTDEQEAYVDDNVGITEWGAKMQEYIDAQKVLSESGYWDLQEPKLYEKRQALRLAKPEIDAILQKWHLYKPVKPPSAFFPPPRGTDPFGRRQTSPFGQQSKTPVFK